MNFMRYWWHAKEERLRLQRGVVIQYGQPVISISATKCTD